MNIYSLMCQELYILKYTKHFRRMNGKKHKNYESRDKVMQSVLYFTICVPNSEQNLTQLSFIYFLKAYLNWHRWLFGHS